MLPLTITMKVKLGVIGCGNMGGAIVRGVVGKGILEAKSILLNDNDIDTSGALAKETGALDEDLCYVVQKSDLLLIAVKPQDFSHLAEGIASEITGQTVISIMAGVRISTITERLGREVPVVRAMPNMGAFVGEGMTCISANKLVNNIEDIKKIFSGIGEILEVEEDQMDAVTAVSGSGPAYLFYLADAVLSAAEKQGLDKVTAKKLVNQMFYGAAALLNKSDISAGELVKKVASKGGTTEAAISVLSERDLKGIVEEAVEKAKKRSEELSGG